MSHLSRRKPNPVEVVHLDPFDQAFLVHTGNLKLINPLETIAEVLKASGDLILWGPQSALMFRVLVNGWKKAGGEDYTDEIVDAFDTEADLVTVDEKRLKAIMRGAKDLGERHWNLVGDKVREILLETQYQSQIFYDRRFEQFAAIVEEGRVFSETTFQTDVGKVEKVTREQFDQWFSTQQPILIQDYINGFPSDVLNPRIAELATQATLKEGVRAVDRAELINRIDRIPAIPHAQFDVTGDVEVARAWNKTAVAMMQGYAVADYQVISERDRKTCPVCQRIDGRCFSAQQAVNKMQEYDGITPGNVQAIRDLWTFPRMDDVDNVPPEAIRDLDLVPPFHPRCRCEVVLLHTRFDGNVSFESVNEIPMPPEQRLMFRDRHMQGWDTHKDATKKGAWRLMGEKDISVGVARHGDNITVAHYTRHRAGVTVKDFYNFGRAQDTTLIENLAAVAKEKGGYLRVVNPASLREVKFLERHWFSELKGGGYQAEGSALDKILAKKKKRIKKSPAKITPAEKIQPATHAPVSAVDEKVLAIEKEIADMKVEHAIVYDDKGEVLFRKIGKEHKVEFTPDELKIFHKNILTHNHPSGVAFSAADVQIMIRTEMRAIRAVGRQYRHEMTVDASHEFIKTMSKYSDDVRISRMQEAWSNSYRIHDGKVRSEFTKAMKEGRMTLIEANRMHHHEVWTRVSDELGWLKYKRENWFVSLNDPFAGQSAFIDAKILKANRGELVIDLGTVAKKNITALGGGVNETQIVTLANGKKGVFKPIKGERFDLRSTIINSDAPLAHREALAWEIDNALKLDLVPETRLVKINGETGSLQFFRDDAVMNSKFTQEVTAALRPLKDEDLYHMSAYDFLIGNTDRHTKNYMRVVKGRSKGKVVAIDNGYAFTEPRGADTMGMQEFRSTPATDDRLRSQGFNKTLPKGKKELLYKRLNNLDIEQLGHKYSLNSEEITAMSRRRDLLVGAIQVDRLDLLFKGYTGMNNVDAAEALFKQIMF